MAQTSVPPSPPPERDPIASTEQSWRTSTISFGNVYSAF